MKAVNYETVKERIKAFCGSVAHVELYIKDDEKKKEMLTEVLGSDFSKEIIGLFKVIKLDDVTILEYDKDDISKNRIIKNIVVVGKDNSVFKLEHYNPINNLVYIEDTISTYDQNKRLINRIYMENLFYVVNVKVLDRIKDTREYFKRNYTFYRDEYEVCSLRVNDDMYLKGESGFESRVNTANHSINQISDKINSKLDELFGIEVVKEYKIIRKKREH